MQGVGAVGVRGMRVRERVRHRAGRVGCRRGLRDWRLRVRWRGLRGGLALALLRESDLFLELFAELTRHGARASDPTTDLRDDTRQLLRPQYDESQNENDQQLGKASLEHAALSEASGRPIGFLPGVG